jgi:hypothetical protein
VDGFVQAVRPPRSRRDAGRDRAAPEDRKDRHTARCAISKALRRIASTAVAFAATGVGAMKVFNSNNPDGAAIQRDDEEFLAKCGGQYRVRHPHQSEIDLFAQQGPALRREACSLRCDYSAVPLAAPSTDPEPTYPLTHRIKRETVQPPRLMQIAPIANEPRF